MKKILFLTMSFLLMIVMGTVYTWSVFRVEVETVYQTRALQSGLPYMTSLFFYALSMLFTGRYLNKENTRKIALSGAIFIVVGWFLASQSTTLLSLIFAYGVLIGIGVGMIYGIPIYIINQRYERSGLYTGIVLGGFGTSPLFTAPLVHRLLRIYDLNTTFLFMSALALLILLPISLTLKLNVSNQRPLVITEYPFSLERFSIMYAMFFIATTIGLMMIGLSYRVGVINYQFNVQAVAFSLSFFAVLNGIARPIFGMLIDRKGFLFCSLLSVSLIITAALVALFNQGSSLILYGLSMGLFWFNLGAWLAIIPASIKRYFGTKNYARHYGIMFTAYGFGAIFGTLLSGWILDVFVNTQNLYFTVLAILVIMFYFALRIQKIKITT